MRIFKIPFGGQDTMIFKRIADYDGNKTPLIGDWGIPIYCFFELSDISGFSANGLTILEPAIIPIKARDAATRFMSTAAFKKNPKQLITTSRREFTSSIIMTKKYIRNITLNENPNYKLTLNRDRTVINVLPYAFTFVWEVWDNGKLNITWTEETETSPGVISSSEQRSSIINDAVIQAMYVLNDTGRLIQRIYVNEVTDNYGNRVSVNKWIENVETYLGGTMAAAFPGADNYIWGEGRISDEPVITNITDDVNAQGIYKSGYFDLYGKFTSQFVSSE